MMFCSHDAIKIFGAPSLYCYVVKSPVFSLQRGDFKKNQGFFSKVEVMTNRYKKC